MGGFQPFLRARREKNLTEGLGDVAEAHWQHTKRRLPWGPLSKRSETAQLFLNLIFQKSRESQGLQATSWGPAVGPKNPGGGPAHASLPCRYTRGPVIQPVSLPLRPTTAVP